MQQRAGLDASGRGLLLFVHSDSPTGCAQGYRLMIGGAVRKPAAELADLRAEHALR
jgi:hypothetical protein